MLGEALTLLKDLVPRGEVAQLEIESPTSDESSLRRLLEKVTQEFPGVWISSHPASRKQGAKIMITLEATAATKEEASSAVGAAQHRLLALVGGAL